MTKCYFKMFPLFVAGLAMLSVSPAFVTVAQGVELDDNPIIPAGAKLELLYTRTAKLNSGLAEGPAVAPDGTIYFTDLPFGPGEGMILRYDPKTNKTTTFTDKSGKSNGLTFSPDGVMYSCDGADGGGRCVRRWDLKSATSTCVADRYHGARFNSPNDLCIDGQGRIYFTDPRYGGTEPRELKHEAVYRLNRDGTVVEITHDVEKPNGVTLSPDARTLYVADHNSGANRLSPNDPEPVRGAMKVYAFPLNDQGLIDGPRRTLVDFGRENGCDGMRVDADGNLYLAARSLARPGILVLNPAGKEIAFIATGPTNQKGLIDDWRGIPSNVEFGLADDSNMLYVTVDKSLYRIRLKSRGFRFPVIRSNDKK